MMNTTRSFQIVAPSHPVFHGRGISRTVARAQRSERRSCVARSSLGDDKHRAPGDCRVQRRHLLSAAGCVSLILLTDPKRALATNGTGSGVDDDESPLIQGLLASSRANKEKYDKERLDDYYTRNFKDYFDFVDGSNRSGENTENEIKIKEWIAKNNPKK
eukprot:CAMPEP_0198212972 /NCGR_PEP_ID=MMETSP1445-20131203/28490_1 /TAXON_ID=36898 /ORGANISM="Pyramimonas sp., Strain CCMP2087" /LENGTH=159 /DNA_ID=CAMNT_0043887553 /DNA_START=89 /DNA_END=568 /DNA_ORIENTATION=+